VLKFDTPVHSTMSLVVEDQNEWRDVGRSQVAMHRTCHFFQLLYEKVRQGYCRSNTKCTPLPID